MCLVPNVKMHLRHYESQLFPMKVDHSQSNGVGLVNDVERGKVSRKDLQIYLRYLVCGDVETFRWKLYVMYITHHFMYASVQDPNTTTLDTNKLKCDCTFGMCK